MAEKFFFTEFDDLEDANTSAYEELPSWKSFIDQAVHNEVTSKESARLWSPTRYAPNTTRAKDNVEALCALVFDFDDVEQAYYETLKDKLKGHEYLLHSTHSHLQKSKFCIRVILPLAKEANPAEWKITRENFADAMEWEAVRKGDNLDGYDAAADHCATFFYWPSHAPGALFLLEKNSGRFVEVDAAPKPKRVKTKTAEPVHDFAGTPGEGQNFIRIWSHAKGKAAEAYKKYKAGLPIAEAGGRDSAMQSDVTAIAEAMPYDALTTIDEKIILDFVAKSIGATPEGSDGSTISIKDFTEKLRRARQWVHGQKGGAEGVAWTKAMAKHAVTPAALRKEEVNQEKKEQEKVLPTQLWTDEEKRFLSDKYFNGNPLKLFLAWGKKFKILTKEGFSQRWLEDREMPVAAKHEKINHAVEGFTWWKATDTNRLVPMDAFDLTEKHGAVLNQVKGSFLGHSRYEETTKTFIEVVNPMVQPQEKFHDEVDLFLRQFCLHSEDYARLVAWLSWFPKLQKSSNVLFLSGKKNTGKTMLMDALAGFWGKKKGVPQEAFFGTFQDALIQCPFIFADEGLDQKMTSSQALRNVITSSQHSINRKGIPRVEVDGYVRMAIATNEDNIDFSDDHMSSESIEAVEARLLRIPVSDAASYYIAEKGGRAWTEKLVSGGMIIEHVKWLSENHVIPEGLSSDSRFPATNHNTRTTAARARLHNALTEPVCEVLHKIIVDGAGQTSGTANKKDRDNVVFKVIDGETKLRLLVSPRFVEDIWNETFVSTRFRMRPSVRVISNILHIFSDEKNTRNVRGEEGTQAKRWSIDLLKFHDHLQAVGMHTDRFVERVNKEVVEKKAEPIPWNTEKPAVPDGEVLQ